MGITRKDQGAVVSGRSRIIGTAGAPNGTGVTVIEEAGLVHKTVINLSSLAMAGTDNTIMWFAQKIYDFPAGSIVVFGATADLALTGSNGVKTGAQGDVGLGTITCDVAGALAGNDQNIIPSTAYTLSSFEYDWTGLNAAIINSGAPFDGTTTPVDLYLNAITDAGDFVTSGTLTVSGTVTVSWLNLGDF